MHSTTYDVLINAPFGLLLVVVTVFVGGTALYIFKRQGKDATRNAARIILSEVKSAENALTGVKSRFFAVDRPDLEPNVLLSHEHWSELKHLFVKPLGDDWNIVDNFYTNCIAYDHAVELDQANLDQLVTNNHLHLSAYYASIVQKAHKTNSSLTAIEDASVEDYKNYEALYLSGRGRTSYIPARSITAARTALVALDTMVINSPAGQKLGKLARFSR